MRRRLLAVIASAVLLPAAAAGSAAADGPSVQAIGQQAASQQSASSSATSTQVTPSNTNISVRIGSPGDGGTVTQTNSSSAASAAGNANDLVQQAQQVAAGVQSADQSAANQQSADSAATSTQVHPQNQNIAVRIMSPGDDGSVTQTNDSSAASAAGNRNTTGQSAGESGGGVQHVGQKASNDQDASSEATSEQKHPSNVNVPVRIYSPGDDGSVTQVNSSSAKSAAGNANATKQESAQDSGGGPSVQNAEQRASNDQSADSSATSKQVGASNVNVPVRIYSPGDDGSVTQVNSSSAKSAAGNLNAADQSAEQSGDGSGALTVQAIGQKAQSAQDASSDAGSEQFAPSNGNAPVRIKSPGGGGDVTQSNSSSAASAAGNASWTSQDAGQDASPSAPMVVKDGAPVIVQAVGQWADNEQSAGSSADSTQKAASNANSPVRIKSRGGDGDVYQSNSASAKSAAGNANALDQTTEQSAGGWADVLVQAIGQKAGNDQGAWSDAASEQLAPSNADGPVAVLSPGDDGSVEQANDSSAASAAGNQNVACQTATQGHGKGPACGQRKKERARRVQ
jgi:hypothetical protein